MTAVNKWTGVTDALMLELTQMSSPVSPPWVVCGALSLMTPQSVLTIAGVLHYI